MFYCQSCGEFLGLLASEKEGWTGVVCHNPKCFKYDIVIKCVK